MNGVTLSGGEIYLEGYSKHARSTLDLIFAFMKVDYLSAFNQENAPSSISTTLSSLVSGIKSVAFDVSYYWIKRLYDCFLSLHDQQSYYKRLMEIATNYEQWSEAATILDQLQGNDQWKNTPSSDDYDFELLQRRLAQLKKARKTGDLSQMIFLLRTSLARNLGDMGQPELYAHTHIGTKRLIEAYINEVVKQMNIICDTESDEISTKAKLEFFTNTRQSFGRTALLLSGGATFGLIHTGVIKSLYECKLLPRIISGASIFERSSDPDTWCRRAIRFLKHVFDVEVFKNSMRKNIPEMTFQEAYNRTRRVLNITVSSSTVYEMPRLLNYLTAPNVLIWSAVAASCSIPLIYNSTPLMAKDKSGNIVPWNPSVNPHVVPFLDKKLIPSPISRLVNWFLFLATSELQHRMNQLSELGVAPSVIYMIQAIVSQRYCGDITIVPKISYMNFLKLLSNPTPEIMGEATLNEISIIRNHCQIELTLDEVIHRLRRRQLEDLNIFININNSNNNKVGTLDSVIQQQKNKKNANADDNIIMTVNIVDDNLDYK
ncbi:11907_t:CDS:10 [Entrophospora sp. SA101]|nr:11907_t:CDS:10 [Entrophospora sp. SA101]